MLPAPTIHLLASTNRISERNGTRWQSLGWRVDVFRSAEEFTTHLPLDQHAPAQRYRFRAPPAPGWQSWIGPTPFIAAGCLLAEMDRAGDDVIRLLSDLTARRIVLPTICLSPPARIAAKSRLISLTESPRHPSGTPMQFPHRVNQERLTVALTDAIQADAVFRKEFATRDRLLTKFATLSSSEFDVLWKLLQGEHVKRIASHRRRSEFTVYRQRATLLTKLGAKSLLDLTRCARQAFPFHPDASTW